MRTCSIPICSVAVLGLAVGIAGPAWAGEPAKVLYVTTSGGFNHSSRNISKHVVADVGRRSGVYEAVYDHQMDSKERPNVKDADAIKHITPEGLKQFDAVFFYTTGTKDTFPLSEENRQALIDFVKGGKAFVGFHSATDTYPDWEPYADMIGGSFESHPWHEEIAIDLEDPSHPATAHLNDRWVIADEIYQFKNYSREKVHVILSMNAASDKGKGGRADHDYPIAWCKRFGKGRVFYTSLGHREEVWADPTYQQHILGGIRWALGAAPGDATPGHPKPANEWKPLFTDLESCPRSGKATWELSPDGILKGTGDEGHIFTKESYRDFEFRALVNISEGGNSGMYFRCKDQAVWPGGYEAQVNNSHDDPVRTGSFYGRDKIYTRLVPKDQPWFTQHVIAVGDHVIIKVNGKVVVDRLDKSFREGTFALQQHHPGSIVQYRKVEVRPLPSPRGSEVD